MKQCSSKAHIKQTGGKLVLRLHKLAAVISAEPQDTSCRLHRWQQQRCATGNNKRKAASSTHWQNSSFLGNFLQGRCCRCCPNLLNTQGGTHDPADSQLTPPGTIKHPCITHWERWCLLSATAPHILIKQPHLGKDTGGGGGGRGRCWGGLHGKLWLPAACRRGLSSCHLHTQAPPGPPRPRAFLPCR